MDPGNPDVVWIGVEFKGVFKSLNGGRTWARSDAGISGYPVESRPDDRCIQEMGKIVVDPADSNHVLLSRIESPGTLAMPFSENAGLWETRDGGQLWTQLLKPGMNASGSGALALGPAAPGQPPVIYLGSNNNPPSWNGAHQEYFHTDGILYQTTDGGATWRELPTGVAGGLRSWAVFVNPVNPGHLWFVVLFAPTDTRVQSSLQWTYLESRDGGETWERGADRFPPSYRAPAEAAVAPANFNHRMLVTMTDDGPQAMFYTTDGGATWAQASHYMFAARYDPHDRSGRRLLGYKPFDGDGIFESRDAGATWQRYANLPPEVNNSDYFGVRISEIVWHPRNPNIVFMSGSGGYAWKSTDSGRTWTTILALEQVGGPNR